MKTINAFVYNDYTFEISPTFEIFLGRLEITSAGRLPDTMTMEEFYIGTSIPRNKEIMRIFKDLKLVESIGIPRIIKVILFNYCHRWG
ncbi:MAG: ATP-binding protein [Rikenellaceae bacterium]